jgi:hypothetical protein
MFYYSCTLSGVIFIMKVNNDNEIIQYELFVLL